MAPSNTEIVFALGAGSRLVGVTEYCDYPPEAKSVESIGSFSDASLERIVSLEPDLVLAARFNSIDVIKALRGLGIPVLAVAPDDIETTLTSIQSIGAIVGRSRAASAMIARARRRIKAVQAKVKGILDKDRPRVLWGRLEVPMFTAGPGSYIHDLILHAGGLNIAGDSKTAWPQIGLETVVSKDPQVIIVSTDPLKLPAEISRLKRTAVWKSIDAVKNDRIIHIQDDLLQRPGPRVVEALEAIARALHPTRFRYNQKGDDRR